MNVFEDILFHYTNCPLICILFAQTGLTKTGNYKLINVFLFVFFEWGLGERFALKHTTSWLLLFSWIPHKFEVFSCAKKQQKCFVCVCDFTKNVNKY